MGCGSCGSGSSGKPGGCKGNGGCSTGGCNRLNVFDWLSTLPLHDAAKPYAIVEISFNRGSRKEYFRNNTHHILEKGAWFAVEGIGGTDVGQVSLTGELVKLQLKKYGVRENDVSKRILHPASEEELQMASMQKDREPEVLIRSRAIARSLKLDMKLCEVEIQADSKKGTFFYTADQRVDFRELIRVFANDFRMKVEMKQIGARQESGKVGGIGSCGRELCCSTWLTDFKSVNTTAARYQNLSINQTKLSGQCGRLKCCLNYELDTYMDALSVFPDHAEHLETVKGVAHLQKRDIFKNLMWYSYSDNNKLYPLSIVRVKEIQKQNKLGQKADELRPVELETRDSKAGKTIDMGFVNDVGQITLRNLEKKSKKKPGSGNKSGSHNPDGRKADGGGQQGSNKGQGNRPQGNKGQQAPGGEPAADGTVNQDGQQPGAKPQGQGNRPQRNRPQQNKNQAEGQPGAEGQPESGEPKQPGQERRPNQQKGGQPRQDRPQGQRSPRPQQPRPAPGEGSGADAAGGEPQAPRPPRPQQQPRPEQAAGDGAPREPRPPRPPRAEQAAGEGGSTEPGTQAPRQGRSSRNNRNRPNRDGGERRDSKPEGGGAEGAA